MPTYKPWPPANPEWPDYVQRMYAAGCVRIDELRKQMEPDGICPIQFRCYGCDESRSDFAMLTDDRVPMCVKCLGFVPTEEVVS